MVAKVIDASKCAASSVVHVGCASSHFHSLLLLILALQLFRLAITVVLVRKVGLIAMGVHNISVLKCSKRGRIELIIRGEVALPGVDRFYAQLSKRAALDGVLYFNVMRVNVGLYHPFRMTLTNTNFKLFD